MRHLRATKDTHEREDAEAERLVRPSPKLKPPRKDKERTRVNVDKDPDLKGDPDMSLNYKTIGGSVTHRVVTRYLTARETPKIRVRRKDTGVVTDITKETLRDRPGEYDVVEALQGKGTPEESPSDATPQDERSPQQVTPKPRSDQELRDELVKSQKGNHYLSEVLWNLAETPDGNPGGYYDSSKPVNNYVRGMLPPEIKTYGDLRRVWTNKGQPAKPELKGSPTERVTQPESEKVKETQEPEKPEAQEPPKVSLGERRKQVQDRVTEIASRYSDFETPISYEEYLAKLPNVERDPRTKALRIRDKSQKGKVFAPSDVPEETLSELLGGYETELKREAVNRELPAHMEKPEIRQAIRDLAVLGGAPTDKSEEKGDVAERLSALRSQGYSFDALPLSKHVPELKDFRLPSGIQTVGDFLDAIKGVDTKPERRETPSQRVVNRFLSEGATSKDFREFAEQLPTTKVKDGTPLFLDKSQKRKTWRSLDQLSPAAQEKIISDYQEHKFWRELDSFPKSVEKPEHRKVFQDLLELDNKERESPLLKRLRALRKSGQDMGDLPVDRYVPELKGLDLPAGIETVEDLLKLAPKFQPPKPVRESVTPEEQKAIYDSVLREMPLAIFKGVMKLHPQDQKDVLEQYREMVQTPPADLAKFQEAARRVYSTDPTKIEPPETVEWEGKRVPLGSLDPKDQAEAIQRYRNKVLALSGASRSLYHDRLTREKLPTALKERLLEDFDAKGAPPEDVYEETRRDGKREPVPSKGILSRIFGFLSGTQKSTASAYYQARDYQNKVDDNLVSGKIHENLSAKDITRSLDGVTKEFDDKEKIYPEGTSLGNTRRFLNRFVDHLDTLEGLGQVSSEKHRQVREWVAERNALDYETALAKWQEGDQKTPPPMPPEDYHEVRPPKTTKSKSKGAWKALRDLTGPTEEESDYKAYQERKRKKGEKPLSRKEWANLVELGSEHIEEDSPTVKVASRYLSTCMGFAMMGHTRNAVYWGVAPYPKGHEGFEPYREWGQAHARDITERDLSGLLSEARKWLREEPTLKDGVEGSVPDALYRAALDYAIRTLGDGKYSVGLHPALYNELLAKLSGQPTDQTLLTARTASGSQKSLYTSRTRDRIAQNTVFHPSTPEIHTMMPKFSSQDADRILARLDRIASTVQSKYAEWGMSFEDAKEVVNALDKTADEIELAAFGAESLARRQAEVLGKTAKVIQRDADESFMDTFKNPMMPHQVEADEKYMSIYKDDQSSAVGSGQSSTGRKLAPHY